MKERIDPFTKEPFIPKRSNQLFANRENQIAFNNQKAKEQRDESRETNLILKENLKILKRILKDNNSATVSRDFLLGAELTFGVFTSQHKHEGRIFNMIYDFGYLLLEDGTYLIKKFKE